MTNDSTRRTFLATSAATGAVTLAGCAGQLTGGSSTTSIKFWHAMGGDTAKLLKQMGSDFESDHEDVSVEVTSKGSYRETLNSTLSAVKAKKPPAVAQIFDIGTGLARTSDAFVSVQDIIPSDNIDYDNFLNPVLNYYRIGDTLNSMPFNSSNPVLYYNKDAFEKAGLDPENPPRTFQGITDASAKLMDSGATKKGITWPNHSWFVEQWMAEQNQLLVDEKNGRAGNPTEIYLESDAAKRIFNWWTDLYEQGAYLNPGIEAWSAAKQAFIAGKVGMLITSTSGISSTTAGAKENGFEMGTGYLPVPKGKRKGVVIGGGSLWVPKGLSDAKQKAAADFLVWLTKPEQQVRWHKNTGYFPVRKEAVSQLQDNGWFDQNPNFKTAFDQLQATKDTMATRGAQMAPFAKTRTIVEKSYVSMIQGTGVDSALASAKKDVESELARSNGK
ncbi:ABC transporter substrate-binding protein [Haladaptatus sp.]|uniref:ABC transporter substrate-binding protein n=1 Tax=Haladaptatus sp. TaxID=1973141 RepID=UPI003C33335B